MTGLRSFVLIVALAGVPGTIVAQNAVQDQPTGSSLEQGLWWLYHLQYDQARKLFDRYTDSHPKDPAGYFYKTAADWWQLAQQFDHRLPEVVERMEQDYQDTVKAAEALLDSKPDQKTKAAACLYAGGAHGLKGRWLVTQKQWVKAYFLGKKGHKLLKKSLEYDPEIYDAYLGLGIYDYYTDTLGGVQKALAALLIRGDRKRGLKQIQWAIEKGRHARVEAMMFLIQIYTWEEHTPEKALPIAQQLRREFPKSPAMHLAEIMDYYELKDWDKVEAGAKDYLEKSRRAVPYFQYEGVYPARYCLGVAAFWGRHDIETCIAHMREIIEHDEKTSRWVTFAYLRTGQVYDMKGEREKALECYQTVVKRPNFWGSHDEARRGIKAPFKF